MVSTDVAPPPLLGGRVVDHDQPTHGQRSRHFPSLHPPAGNRGDAADPCPTTSWRRAKASRSPPSPAPSSIWPARAATRSSPPCGRRSTATSPRCSRCPTLLERYPRARGSADDPRGPRRRSSTCATPSPGSRTCSCPSSPHRGIPLPQTNVTLEAVGGRYRVDCFWPEAGLVVELDGRDGHARELAFEADRERDGNLLAAGYRVLRVTRLQLEQAPDLVERRLRAALASRRRAPGPLISAADAPLRTTPRCRLRDLSAGGHRAPARGSAR